MDRGRLLVNVMASILKHQSSPPELDAIHGMHVEVRLSLDRCGRVAHDPDVHVNGGTEAQ